MADGATIVKINNPRLKALLEDTHTHYMICWSRKDIHRWTKK